MLTRRQLIRTFLAGALLPRPAQATPTDNLRFGVLPVMSARALLETFQPLLAHLEGPLRRRIELGTAPHFPGLYQRLREGQFDFALVPPHFARLAQAELGWSPLARCAPEHRCLLLVPEDSRLGRPEELRGGTLAILDRTALVALIAVEALRQRGLREGRDYALLETRGYESSRLSVQQGLAQAFVSRSQGFFKGDQRDRFRPLLDAGVIPGYVFLGSPRLDFPTRLRLIQLLLDFPRHPEATALLEKLGYQTIEPVTEADMRRLDPYLEATRGSLAQAS